MTTKNNCEPIVPPIYETSLFYYPTFQDMISALRDQQHHYVYTRGKNPTVEIVEKQIAELEGGEACLCFGSGMGAISAAVLSCLKSGDHVLAVGNIYGPTIKLLQYLDKFGITFSVIHSMDVGTIRGSIRANTKAIYLESPTTMNFQIVDLPEVARLAKQNGIHTIVDNSWATPLFQKPLQRGIDMVVHSASKYLGGHSDLVAGTLITSNKRMERIFVGEY
jgi:cystathionine beta-lyase/cystathionine gamma-synthase